MANRLIPYGYNCENGIYKADESEHLVLREIFDSYLKGQSLLQISKALNQAGTPFYLDKCGWNKARIKRILADKRYLGNGNFPQLISEDIFAKAVQLAEYKSCAYNADPISTTLKSKAYCKQCGSRMIYNNKCHGYPKWVCSSPECSEDSIIKAPAVEQAVTAIMNAVISNPQLLDGIADDAPLIMDNETSVKLNEINRRMNQRDISFEEIQSLIFEYADMLYQKSSYGINQKLTKILKQTYGSHESMKKLDTGLFNSTVSGFTIAKDGSVEITFINGVCIPQNITERSTTDA